MELSTPLFPEYLVQAQRKPLPKYSYILKATDIHTFAALWELKFATVEHIQHYRRLSNNSIPKLRQQLVILAGESKKATAPAYLQRFCQSRSTPFGSLPFVYGLTELSKKELAARGYDISIFGRIKKVEKRLPSDIDHHFAVNDFYLAARELETLEPQMFLRMKLGTSGLIFGLIPRFGEHYLLAVLECCLMIHFLTKRRKRYYFFIGG